jgi:hypothetical protein
MATKIISPLKNKNKTFSAYCFLKVHFHHFSKMKSPKEVTKQRFFLLFFLDEGRIRIRIHTNGSGSGRAQKHLDLVDPDTEHCRGQ